MPEVGCAEEYRDRARQYRRARARSPEMRETLIRLVDRYEDLAEYLEERAGKAEHAARR
jgi:hypothetical protein